jgi:hypothetical protein
MTFLLREFRGALLPRPLTTAVSAQIPANERCRHPEAAANRGVRWPATSRILMKFRRSTRVTFQGKAAYGSPRPSGASD